MNIIWTVLLPLVEPGPKPEDVKAGWVAFGLFLLLILAVVFLAFSLRKHLGRVNFEEKDDTAATNGTDPAH
jgi:hypothetical protein